MPDKSPSPKVLRFLSALEALCKEHGVKLITDKYRLQVWDENQELIRTASAGIEDCTITPPLSR